MSQKTIKGLQEKWDHLAADSLKQAVKIAERDAIIASQAAQIEQLREALTQIASGNVFETAFPTPESITVPELEDGYLVASEFARAALQPKEEK